MRLTAKGMLRWYTECCRTPIGNTPPTPGIPFIGAIVSITARSLEAPADGSRPLEEIVGPVTARVYCRFATGTVEGPNAHARGPLSMVVRFIGTLLGRRLRGEHRRGPLFDRQTGAPRVVPHVLSAEALREVRQALQGR